YFLQPIIIRFNHFMKHSSRRCAIGALAAGLASMSAAVLFGAPSPAIANPLRCNPDLIVENGRDTAIKVTKVEYTVKDKTGTFTDGITNKRLAPDEEEEWKTVSLRDVANGNVITGIRYEFKPDTSGTGGGPISDPWGSPRWSDWQGHAANCADGLNYPHRIN
ncbi:MAG: hypothetical protein MUC48_25970, partial [Leptolyngbya sp. Prado105]|nr:hypothetical protein [Leptolyngbya sp. Prado105]